MSEKFFDGEARNEAELTKLFHKYRTLHKLDFDAWLLERTHCRTDLFWFSKEILGKDLLEKPHRAFCDFWVKKDFSGVYYEGYTLADVHAAIKKQDTIHERIQLCPRGSYKSSIDECDVVQWLINVPDIRILILTGESTLGDAFLRGVKNHFFLRKDATPTRFQQLFPEYIITGDAGENVAPLVCPARRLFQKEASVWTNSVTSSLSGWHCDLFKGDDVVTDRNSTTEDTREKINKRYDGAFNLLDEWGFADSVGTPYATGDWYDVRLKLPREDAPLAYMRVPAWTIKEPFKDVPLKELNADMVELLFPEKLDFKSLRRKLLGDPLLFRAQQLCEWSMDSFSVLFDILELREHVIPAQHVPVEGGIFIAWDWAPTSNSKSDFSAGAVGKICGNTLYVLEILYGRWNPSDLCYQVLELARKWNPRAVFMEESAGAEFFKKDIQRTAIKYRMKLPVMSWKSERIKDAKARRVKSLEVLLHDEKLFFVDGPWIDDSFRMFEDFKGYNQKRKRDDIPDAVAMLQRFLPKPVMPTADSQAQLSVDEIIEEQRKACMEKWEQQVAAAKTGTLAGVGVFRDVPFMSVPRRSDKEAPIHTVVSAAPKGIYFKR